MYNRAQMKQSVKKTIAATRPRPIWVALLFTVIVSIGASVINSVVTALSGVSALSTQLMELLVAYEFDMEAALSEMVLLFGDQLLTFAGTLISGSVIASLLVALWQSLMNVGYQGYCLSLVKGENPGIGKVFCGFPLIGKVILTAILRWVFTFLWTLLYIVILGVIVGVGALLMGTVSEIFIILPILGYVVFIVLMIRLALRYAMAEYFMLDTGIYGLDAITASKQMMKGRKGKLFMLGLSFIGWYLLEYAIVLIGSIIIGVLVGVGVAGAATSGSLAGLAGLVIGALVVLIVMLVAVWLISVWLYPYINGSMAKFYLTFKPQGDDPAPLPVGETETPQAIEPEFPQAIVPEEHQVIEPEFPQAIVPEEHQVVEPEFPQTIVAEEPQTDEPETPEE